MAWQYVGGTSAVGTSTGYTVSLTGLTGGIASAPAQNDLIVVFSGFGNTASSAPNITGNNSGAYIAATAAQHVNDTWDTEFRSFYRVAGATPDTSLTVTRVTNAAYGGATVVHVWRGVDTAGPFIGAATPTSGGNGAALNPPSYNPAVTDALVIAGGAGTMPAAGTAGYTAITGLSNIVTRYGDGSTADISVIMGSVLYAGSAIDPPVATGGTQNNTSSSWAGVNIAFRMQPDPVVHDTTGALTGQIGSVAGSAQHNIPHGTSGDLAGSEAVIVGSADHTGGIVDHATTGALTGQGSTVAGSAERFRAFASSGTLTGQGAAIVGSASNFTPHGTSGALTGQGSAVAGSAARFRAFASSGALTGSGALLDGAAERTGVPIVHDTSGALDGGAALLEAIAAKEGLTPANEIEPIGGAFNIPTRQQMRDMVQKQRIALGILPKPVQKKAKAAAKCIARIALDGGTAAQVQAALEIIPPAQRVDAMSAVQVSYAYYLAVQTQAQKEIARIQAQEQEIAEILAEIERTSTIQREEDDIAFLLMQVIMAE